MDRIFQNIRADFLEISEILEILEIRKVRGENFGIFGNFGTEFGRADRHPSDDRPCTTTQLRGHGLSTGGGDHTYIYIYIHNYKYNYICKDIYIYIHTPDAAELERARPENLHPAVQCAGSNS